MFVPFVTFLFTTSLYVHPGAALDIDVKDQKSIKEAAKTLAGGIVAQYNDGLKENLIPGLFPDPYYWWEAGAVFDSLIEYSALTGDNQYDDLIGEAMFHQAGEHFDYMPANQSKSLGNDDQSTWALAAMSAAERGFSTSKLGNLTWINLAKTVWESQAARWDNETCDGGFRWQIYPFNNGFDYKNTISQGQFILLSTRLAKFTGNSTYSDWAAKAFKWTQDLGLIDDSFHIYDGASAQSDCSKIDKIQWSHNNGILAEAAALMYNLTKGSEEWKDVVSDIVKKTSEVFKPKKDGVLYEVACELNGKCNTDQRAYKGLLVRSLARAAVSAPFVSDTITSTLETSAKAATQRCSGKGDDLKCNFHWDPSRDADKKDGALGESFSALAVVQALLVKDAKVPATESTSGNATATDNHDGSALETSGSANTAEHDGAADALAVSRGLVLAGVMVAALLL